VGSGPLLVRRASIEAAIWAGIAAVLGLPLIGFRLIDLAGGEGFETRWRAFAAAIGLTFLFRLTVTLTAGGAFILSLPPILALAIAGLCLPWPSYFLEIAATITAIVLGLHAGFVIIRRGEPNLLSTAGESIKPAGKFAPWLLIGFALILPAMPFASRGTLDVAVMILIYILLGWGLNIVTGLAGLLDLGYAAFFAIGAYVAAILGTTFGLSFWACLPLSAILAAAAGILLGFPVLRLRGDYFAIVTLGFGEIIRIVANNWRSLTNGSQGIGGAPRPNFFGIADFTASAKADHVAFSEMFGISYSPLQRLIFLYYLILAVALAVNFFTLRIRRLPIGRAWEALREDEIAAQALGISRRNVKLTAFAIGAAWGGIGGTFVGARLGFVTPESFGFMESVMVTAIVVLGGMGSQIGIVIAATLIIGLSEFFRPLAEYRMLVFGLAMILIMRFRPRGLVATRRPTAVLK
jgi:branched-chain amino acid transport system permease protein